MQDDELSKVLSEFAHTLVTDFPIQGILDHLVERVVEVLPVTAAGVTLIDEEVGPRYVAASNAFALRFEQLQAELGQGPCVAAYQSGEAVTVPDLAGDPRFPIFGPAAVAGGLAAVFTFPLRDGSEPLGALDLYCDATGPLDDRDVAAAQTLADVVVAYLLNARWRQAAKATADRLHHIALHDSLTGLPNRLLLEERLEHAAQRASRTNANAAVIYADLDRFKEVNDTFGHAVGDELLRAVGERLGALVRPGDTLARVYGDEFVFLLEDLRSPDDVELLADRIAHSFAEPFHLRGLDLNVRASIGMAFAGPGTAVSEQLIVEADAAMYAAKRGVAPKQVLDLRVTPRTSEASGIEEELRHALVTDDLGLAYQPIVRCTDGHVTCVEALLRWHHRMRGSLPAALVVGVAERVGLIDEVGRWVLHRACRDHVAWTAARPDLDVDLAVNVSAHQLMNPGFPTDVAAVLDRTGMDASRLILEVTENVLIDESTLVPSVLDSLRRLGIRIALDDFGTGYSSLSYLRRLPVQIVKVDQSFVADIDGTPAGSAIVAAVTTMAHHLDLTVVAEGVETASQRDGVQAMGCDWAQGLLIARPMNAAAVAQRLGAGASAG